MRTIQRRLGHVAQVLVSNVDKHSHDGEVPVRLCNYVDVYHNEVVHPGLELMTATATPEEIARFRLHTGDTVFTKDSETADDIGIPAYVSGDAPDFVCGYHLAIARPYKEEIHPKYLFWWLSSREVAERWSIRASGVTRVGLRQPDMRALPLEVVPDTAEQREIADFLDRETAQIDAMVDAQERLVGLLEERRKAVLLDAVTTGVDRSTTSAGTTPSHWKTLPIKAFGRTQSGAGFPEDEQGLTDLPIPFYKVNALGRADSDGVIRDRYDTVDAETAARLRAAVIPAGSVVLAKIGAALLLGRFRLLAYDSCIDNNMLAFIPNERALGRYVMYAFEQLDLARLVNPGTIPSLSDRVLRDFRFPWPPVNEQAEIVEYLDRTTARIDAMIAKAQESIALMKERRAALISAAVTGRIDVRTGVERVERDLEEVGA